MRNRTVYLQSWADKENAVTALTAAGLEAKLDEEFSDIVYVVLPASYPAQYDLGNHIRTRMLDLSVDVKFVCDPQPQCVRYAIGKQRNDL